MIVRVGGVRELGTKVKNECLCIRLVSEKGTYLFVEGQVAFIFLKVHHNTLPELTACYLVRRADTPNILLARLFSSLPPDGNRLSSNSPVVSVHLINDDNGRGRVLAKYIHQQLSHPLDQGCLLLGTGTFFGDFDIDVRHDLVPFYDVRS